MKTYKLKEKGQKNSMIAVVVITAILLVFFITTGYILFPVVPALIVLIFSYYWHKKNDVLVFDTDYLEFKFSPFQSKKFIKYTSLTDLKYNPKKKVVLLFTDEKKVKLPLGGLEDQDAEETLLFLRELVKQDNVAA
ncbi:hypothetical protein [Marixanthomonas spongiae]|uniref:Uncharacterized protein n=1 Tax=Marixanthomonas spongiae TaxID=2174845 RepID=A0A2U0HS95_9FLAO|nr:hypothetical protein [Marixanthomonas spongiae]PVW11715.1 hypothetical protein DDV96_15570 [Marixanthomonas spongiae]